MAPTVRRRRVVVGQHVLQAASDIFLGWATDQQGRRFYLRQHRDAKISPDVEMLGALELIEYAKFCGWTLAASCCLRSDPEVALAG